MAHANETSRLGYLAQRGTRFQRIAPHYLLHTARMKCTWCYHEAGGNPEAAPWLITVEEVRKIGTNGMHDPKAQRLVVRRAIAHYAMVHPEVTLPV